MLKEKEKEREKRTEQERLGSITEMKSQLVIKRQRDMRAKETRTRKRRLLNFTSSPRFPSRILRTGNDETFVPSAIYTS